MIAILDIQRLMYEIFKTNKARVYVVLTVLDIPPDKL